MSLKQRLAQPDILIAPGVFNAFTAMLAEREIDTRIPYTVDTDGFYTQDAPGFEGRRVITDKGEKGDANEAVIKALAAAGNIIARGQIGRAHV